MKTEKTIGLIAFYVLILIGVWIVFRTIIDLYLLDFLGEESEIDKEYNGLVCEFKLSYCEVFVSFLFGILMIALAFLIRKKRI